MFSYVEPAKTALLLLLFSVIVAAELEVIQTDGMAGRFYKRAVVRLERLYLGLLGLRRALLLCRSGLLRLFGRGLLRRGAERCEDLFLDGVHIGLGLLLGLFAARDLLGR